MKRKNNIELFGKLTDNYITIKGNKLNLRWFDKCILIWSDENKSGNLPKKFLEIIEKEIKNIFKQNSQQIKKDKDDGSNVSLSGDTKQRQGKKIEDEHMSVGVDNQSAGNSYKKFKKTLSRLRQRN